MTINQPSDPDHIWKPSRDHLGKYGTVHQKPEPLIFDASMHEGPEEQKARLIGLREGYYWVRLRDYLGGNWVVMQFKLFEYAEDRLDGLQLVNKWRTDACVIPGGISDARFITGFFQTHNLEQIGPYLGTEYTGPMEDQRGQGQHAEQSDRNDYTAPQPNQPR